MNIVLHSIRWRLTSWYSISIALIFLAFACCVFLTFRYSCCTDVAAPLIGDDIERASSSASIASTKIALGLVEVQGWDWPSPDGRSGSTAVRWRSSPSGDRAACFSSHCPSP